LTVAQKPDGKSARTERVTFTRPAAERIAKVVRAVEGGDRDTPGIYFGSAPASQQKTFRVCTFTGAWSKNSDKTVTFKNQTSTPNTVSAQNLFISLPGSTASSSSRTCGIARDGTAWHLIQWEWEVTDVLSGASLGTAALEFTRVNAPYLATAATVQISVTTCSTAAS
jgi:hypothetical protein